MRLGVHVSCSPDFADHPKAANGASDVLLALFGRKKQEGRACATGGMYRGKLITKRGLF